MKKINLGVSNKHYDEKPENFKGIKFQRTTVSVEELINLIKNGHVFCHNYGSLENFRLTDKTDSNFSETNLIWFDFDDCKYSIDELYTFSRIKPTIAYTTFSNNSTRNRFRFIYVIEDKITNVEEYQNITNLILNLILERQIILDLIEDKKGIDFRSFRPNQMFLGSKSDCILFFEPELIFKIKDLINYAQTAYNNVSNTDVDKNVNNFKFVDSFSNVEIIDFHKYKCHKNSKMKNFKKKRETVLENGKNVTEIIEKALEIINAVRFVPQLNNFEKVTYTSDVYTFVGNENIYQVNTFFGKNKKIMEGKRNKAIYYQVNVLININPKIKIEELVANLIWLRNKYFQNPDTYSISDIVYSALNVLNEHRENDMGKKTYVIRPEYVKTLSKTEKLKFLGEARSKKRDETILPNFDCNISVKENAEFIGVSTSTIYNSIKYNYVTTKKQNAYIIFKQIYFSTPEENRTVRKMAEIANVNRGKSERYIRKIKSETESLKNL